MFCITGIMYDSISVDSIKYHYRLPQSTKQTTGNQQSKTFSNAFFPPFDNIRILCITMRMLRSRSCEGQGLENHVKLNK